MIRIIAFSAEDHGYDTLSQVKPLDCKQTLEKPKGQSRMDNPEKLTTLCTQDTRRRQTKQKNTTQYVWDSTMRTQTQIA